MSRFSHHLSLRLQLILALCVLGIMLTASLLQEPSPQAWIILAGVIILTLWLCHLIYRLRQHCWHIMQLSLHPAAALTPGRDELHQAETRLAQLGHCLADQQQRIEQQRRQLELRPLHDPLTGLPNRDCFLFEVRRHLATLQRHPEEMALVLLEVRDTRQHRVADDETSRQLQQMADILRQSVRDADLLCYMQHRIFAILLTRLADRELIHLIMQKLQSRLDHAIRLGNYPPSLHFAAGIVQISRHDTEAGELLHQAELALNAVEPHGERCYQLFTHQLQQHSARQQFIEQHLTTALQNGEIFLQYQPVRAVGEQRWVMLEALARWQLPMEGLLKPESFVPILDKSPLGRKFSRWVLEHALQQLRQLDSAGSSGLQISINLSGFQLLDPELPALLDKLTLAYHIIPSRVVLEVNEQAVRLDYTQALERMLQLREAGYRLALDDFGTGYSALTYISQLPLDYIKLDGQFTLGMLDSPIDRQMIGSIIQMGRAMNRRVISEGVQSREQADMLLAQGCDWLQGHLLMPPVGECDLLSQLLHVPALLQPYPDR